MGIVNTVPFLGGVVFQPLTGTLFDLFGAVDKPFPIIAYRLFFTVLTMALLVATISAFRTAEKSTVSAP